MTHPAGYAPQARYVFYNNGKSRYQENIPKNFRHPEAISDTSNHETSYPPTCQGVEIKKRVEEHMSRGRASGDGGTGAVCLESESGGMKPSAEFGIVAIMCDKIIRIDLQTRERTGESVTMDGAIRYELL